MDGMSHGEGAQGHDWNPRFVAYAKAHHCDDPAEQMRRDEVAWPGGCMVGFMLWIGERHLEFYEAHPEAFCDRNTIRDLGAWDRFLGVPEETE